MLYNKTIDTAKYLSIRRNSQHGLSNLLESRKNSKQQKDPSTTNKTACVADSVVLVRTGRRGGGRSAACTLHFNQQSHITHHDHRSKLTLSLLEAVLPDAVPTIVDIVTAVVLPFGIPAVVVITEAAEVEITAMVEVCVVGVVMATEFVVTERVVAIGALGLPLVEMSSRSVYCQRCLLF